jgi:hypothetical protein
MDTASTPNQGSMDQEFLSVFTQRADDLYISTRKYKSIHDNLSKVLDYRPFYPKKEHVDELRRPVWTWEELVSLFTGIQRGLREMELHGSLADHVEVLG